MLYNYHVSSFLNAWHVLPLVTSSTTGMQFQVLTNESLTNTVLLHGPPITTDEGFMTSQVLSKTVIKLHFIFILFHFILFIYF